MAAGEVLISAAELVVTPRLLVLRLMVVRGEAHGAVALWPGKAMVTPRDLAAVLRELILLAALAALMVALAVTVMVMELVTARQALAAAAAGEWVMTAVTVSAVMVILLAATVAPAALLTGMAPT